MKNLLQKNTQITNFENRLLFEILGGSPSTEQNRTEESIISCEKGDLDAESFEKRKKLCESIIDPHVLQSFIVTLLKPWDDTSTNPSPSIKEIHNKKISPKEYPILQDLYGNFDPLSIQTVYFRDARIGGATSSDNNTVVIGMGEYKNKQEHDQIFVHEAAHAINRKYFKEIFVDKNSEYSFNKINIPFEISKSYLTNQAIGELIGFSVSFSINPTGMFGDFNESDKEGKKDSPLLSLLKKDLKTIEEELKTNISEEKKDNLLKQKAKYENDLSKLNAPSERSIEEKLSTQPSYVFVYKFFEYQKQQNPNIKPEEMAEKLKEKAKEFIDEAKRITAEK